MTIGLVAGLWGGPYTRDFPCAAGDGSVFEEATTVVPESQREQTAGEGPMTVAVTGATGFVGRYVVGELARRGRQVRALVRDIEKSKAALRPGWARLVQGDLFDSGAREALLEGADAVVHLVGIRREMGRAVTFRRLHVEATRVMVEEASRLGVGRFVQMSALGAGPESRAEYALTKYEAEQIVRESGLRWTIFRPSVIHGPDGEFMQLVKGWVTGQEAPWKFLPYFFRVDERSGEAIPGSLQPVAVEDVAQAIAESLEQADAVGEVYPLGGPEALTWPEALEAARDAIPDAVQTLKPRGLSGAFAAHMARAAELAGLGGTLPFGPSEPILGMEDNTCTTAKARAHLDFAPKAFAETVAAYADEIGAA